MNAGLIGSTNKDFWKYWIEKNLQGCEKFPYQEQDVLNLIIQEGKFKFECLDTKKSNVHYGISCHYGKDGYWESSKEIKVEDGKFKLGPKIIKVWHQAGGSQNFPKLQLNNFFNESCVKEINRILSHKIITYNKIVIP